MEETSSRWLWFATLLLVETMGALLIISQCIPFYRETLMARSTEHASMQSVALAFTGAVAIIVASWQIQHQRMRLSFGDYEWVGRIIQFCGRLSFVFATSMFSSFVYLRIPEIQVSAWRLGILAFTLFAMFCYMLELERFAKSFMASPIP